MLSSLTRRKILKCGGALAFGFGFANRGENFAVHCAYDSSQRGTAVGFTQGVVSSDAKPQ